MHVLELNSAITLVPVIHGSGDFAMAIRRLMLNRAFDCLAVPLPESFRRSVQSAIEWLPSPTIVANQLTRSWQTSWQPDAADEQSRAAMQAISYVPIDPCQPVIAALRIALGEHIPAEFIDLETEEYQSYSAVLPDPYALKRVSIQRFAAAMLPTVPPLPHEQARQRVAHMGARLRKLAGRYRSILCLCSILDWPWLRDAYHDPADSVASDLEAADTIIYQPDPSTVLFMLGELPFITGLYERARRELEDDENLSVDGIKELLISARGAYEEDFKNRSRQITPHTLSTILKYVRNLTLMDRRMTPDLFNLVTAAKQVAGDGFALHVAEQAREYPFFRETPFPTVTLGIDELRLPNGDIVEAINRLPGVEMQWRSCELRPRPSRRDRHQWEMGWNEFSQCSWPPEDKKIEDFRSHVVDRAKSIIGMDLAKIEKFTTSIEDGIDIRETLRNWHTGDLYVKVMPPVQGRLDAVVMLFESPLDPREYPWRTTWFAENQNESTLAFCASDYHQEMVGPGIAMGVYGAAMFLFPPVAIHDIWLDPRLDFTTTLEERILAAACLHSQAPHIALVSPLPPGPGWRRLAARFKKKWVHVPLGGFSQSTLQQLRIVHVLNGQQVRSYAADFIRRA